MRKQTLFLIALGVAALVQFESRSAEAQVFGFGGNLTGLPYNYFQSQQELPFYAKFPPVYYSYPVARPYGYSPFAYPPGIMTPELPPVADPVEIVNPYVPAQPSKPPAQLPAPSTDARRPVGPANVAQSRAKVILNPYVNQAQTDEQLTFAK